jgi:hypothetical protein
MSDVSVNIIQEEVTVVFVHVDEHGAQAALAAVAEARLILQEIKNADVSNKLDKDGYAGTAKTLKNSAKIYENGELQIFRKPGTDPDPNNTEPNAGDMCVGFVEGLFITAPYLSGNKNSLTSFDI